MAEFSASQLSQFVGGCLHGNSDKLLTGVATLNTARAGDVACIAQAALVPLLKAGRASLVVLPESLLAHCYSDAIVVNQPFDAFARIVTLFESQYKPLPGIDPSVSLGKNVQLADDVSLGPQVSIGDDCIIEEGVTIGAATSIGDRCIIGKGSVLATNVSLSSGTTLGSAVCIHSGVVIGGQAFNPLKCRGRWVMGEQLGGVVIEDAVEIGANTVIDRGSLSDTYIATGVKIDNLVQIGHDVVIGAHTAIVACAAIGAYTVIGEHCIIGGASAIASQLTIADNVTVTGMATVNKSLLKSDIYSSGTNVARRKLWRKNAARFHHLDTYVRRVKNLERQMTRYLSSIDVEDKLTEIHNE